MYNHNLANSPVVLRETVALRETEANLNVKAWTRGSFCHAFNKGFSERSAERENVNVSLLWS